MRDRLSWVATRLRALVAPAYRRARLVDNAILLWSYRQSLRAEAGEQVNIVFRPTAADFVAKYVRRLRGFRQTLFYPAVVVIGIVLLLAAPVSMAGFDDRNEHWREWLLTFWGVSAAVVGLATAVNVFVFQIFATRSTGQYGTLLEFAYDTLLLDLVVFGVAGLIATAVSLYASSSSATGGWGAMVAALSLGTPVALLPFVFRSSLRAIEPSELESRRRRRLLDGAKTYVDRIALEGAALSILQAWAENRSVQIDPWTRRVDEDEEVVASTRSGTVADVDLNALGRLQAMVNDYAPGRQIRLVVQLGAGVAANGQLLIYPAPLDDLTRQIARAVVRVRA